MNPNDATTIANFLTANFAYEMQTTERVINAVRPIIWITVPTESPRQPWNCFATSFWKTSGC